MTNVNFALPVRWHAAWPWLFFIVALVAAPLAFSGGLGLSVLSQLGIAIILCLAYNLLLGQGGMLSFGHAVYSGMGAFAAVSLMNAVTAGKVWLPVSLVPLAGGLAGAALAALLGYVTTRMSGTPFAMITLGICELVHSLVLMMPGLFGGEGGISTNRVIGAAPLGITFGPQVQVYYLVATYCLACTAAMYGFTRTPLGRMLNAVRDNPQRVAFIGYNTRQVRYLSFIISAFFGGIAGGLAAINLEIVNADSVSAAASGVVLFYTVLGGAAYFFGPILGAVLMVVGSTLLSDLTKAWPLYLGLGFLFMVMFAPGGLAAMIVANVRVARHGLLGRLARPYAGLVAASALALMGFAALVEMVYHIQLNDAGSTHAAFFGMAIDTRSGASWLAALVLMGLGAAMLRLAQREFAARWDEVQEAIGGGTAPSGVPRDAPQKPQTAMDAA